MTPRGTLRSASLLACALAALHLHAPEARAGRLRAAPASATVSIESGADLRLSLDLEHADGRPKAGLVFLAESNFGSVGKVSEVEPGRYEARLRLPPTDMPRAAVVAFAAQESESVELHHVVVPVVVETALRARTEPRSEVTIQVAGRSYGPVRADRAGWFTISFLQPPGAEAAEVAIVDPAGNVQRSELPVPRRPHDALTVMLDRYRARSDGTGRVSVHALVFDESGRPLRGVRILSVVDKGLLGDFVDHGDGVHAAEWRAPSDGQQGVATLKLSVRHAGSVHEETERIRLERGLPGRLALSAEPTELVAGEVRDVRVSVLVQDAAGNGLPGQAVRLSADRGSLDELRELGDGRYESRLVVPEEVGSGSIEVKALLPTASPAKPPVRLDVSANPEVVPTSWRAFSLVTATLSDEAGEPVAGEVVLFHLSRGEGVVTPAAVTNADGRAFADFSADPNEDVVVVEATSTSVPSLKGDTRIEKRRSGEFAIVDRPALAAQGGVPRSVVEVSDEHRVLQDSVLITLLPGAPASLGLSADPSSLVADGESISRVTAVLTDARGNEIPGAPVRFGVDVGSIGEGSNVGDGRYLALFTSPAGAGSGRAVVTATEGESGLTASTSIELEVGPPARLALLVDREELPADGTSRALLTATVEDASGTPVPGALVRFRHEGAEVDLAPSGLTGADGRAEAPLTAGHEPGPVELIAEVEGVSRESLGIELLPTEPVLLRLSASPTRILANGVDVSEIEAQLEDAFGQPVAGRDVEFSLLSGPAQLSTRGPVRSDSLGVSRVRLGSLEAGMAVVRARTLGRHVLSEDVQVELMAAALTASFAVSGPPCAGSVRLESGESSELGHEWDWTGDGAADATGTSVLAPLPAGTHRVRLTVRDGRGGIAAAEQDVEVAAPPLAVAVASRGHAASGTCVDLDGTGSSAADGGALVHAWDLDGDGVEDETGPTTTFCAADGDRRARLTVRQADGCEAVDEIEVVFGNVPVLTIAAATPGTSLPIQAGKGFDLELRWGNAGLVPAEQVLVGLELSAELHVDGALPTGGVDLGGGRLRFPLGDLAPGTNGAFKVPLRATAEPSLPSSLARAVASATHQEAVGQRSVPVTAALSLPIVPAVDLALACIGPSAAQPGEVVEIDLDLSNRGASTARDPVLELEWNVAELELLESEPAGTGDADSARFEWIQLGGGQSLQVRLRFRVRSVLPSLLVQVRLDADARHAGTDLGSTDNACRLSIEVPAEPDAWLSVRASPERSPARPGDSILYELSYGNRGSTAAEGTVIEGRFDPGIFASSLVENPDSGVFSASAGTIRFLIGRVPADPARTHELRYRVRVDDGLPGGPSEVRTEVNVLHSAPDGQPGDDQAAVTVPLESAPDLSLSVDLSGSASAGALVPVRLTLTSTGDVPAEGVVVEHELSGAGAQVEPSSLPPGAVLLPSGAVRFTPGDMPIGAVQVLRYELRLAALQDSIDPTLSNRWTADFGGVGASVRRILDRDLLVLASPRLDLALLSSTSTAAAGDRIELSATLTAAGSAPHPAGLLELESPDSHFGGVSPGSLPFPELRPGDVRVLGPWSLDVLPVLPTARSMVSLTARVTGTAAAGTATIELTAEPSLDLRIASLPAESAAGEWIDFVVAVSNDGTTAATGLELSVLELLGVTALVERVEPELVALGGLPADGLARQAAFRALMVAAVPGCRTSFSLAPRARFAESAAALTGPGAAADLLGEPDLRLELTAVPSVDPPGPADFITYTLRVTNAGEAPALGPAVRLQRDLLLLPDALPPLPAGATQSGSEILIPLPDLAPLSTLSRTLRLRVASSLPAPTNWAVVTAVAEELSCETRTADNQATLGLNVGAVSDVVVSMDLRADPADMPAGGSLGLSVYLSNAGTTDAEDVALLLEYPPELVASVGDAGGADSGTPGRLLWTGMRLDAGSPPLRLDASMELQPALPSTSNLFQLSARATTTSPENRLDNNLAEATRTARAWADLCLELEATPIPEPAAASGRLRYDLLVRNDGTTTARGTLLQLDYDSDLLTPMNGSGDPLEWLVGDLAPGASLALAEEFRIAAAIPGGTAVAVALATATAPEHDAWARAACDASARMSTVISDQADLALTKSATWTDPVLVRGSRLQYTLVVSNVGNSNADNGPSPAGTVEDFIPPGLLVRSVSGGSWDGSVLRWDLPNRLRRGESWTTTYEVEIDPDLGAAVHRPTNLARVLPALPDGSTANDSDSVELELRFDVDLSTTATCRARPSPAVPGSLLEYVVEVVNRGSYEATSLQLELGVGPSVELEPPLSGSLVTVAGPARLGPQERWTYQFEGRSLAAFPDELTTVVLSARAWADQADADPGNDEASTSCNVLSSVDMRASLSVSEVDGAPPIEASELLDVTVVVDNVGSRIEDDTRVVVEYDASLAVFESSADFAPDGAGRLLHVHGGPFDPRDPPELLSLRLRIVDTLPSPLEVLPICATVGSTGPDVSPSDNSACTQLQLFATPDLRIARSFSTPSDPARPGEPISHEVRIENVGTTAATDVSLEHLRDPSRTTGLMPGSASHPSEEAGARILLSVGTVEPGPAGAVLVAYQVGLQSVLPAIDNSVTSTVCALLDEMDAQPGDNCAVASVLAEALPDAWVALRVEPSAVLGAGEGATAFIDYGNAGASPLVAPELRLELDPSLLLADGSAGTPGPFVSSGLPSLAPGEARQEVVPLRVAGTLPQVTVAADATARLLHQHSARDASPADDSATVSVELRGTVDLVAEARLASPATPTPGELLSFEVTWRNQGSTTAIGAELSLVPHDLLLTADGSAPASPDQRALGDLSPGATGLALLEYRLPEVLPSESTVVSLLAGLTSAVPDQDPGNDSSLVEVVVAASPDLRVLALSFTASPAPAEAGSLLDVSAQHDNHGSTAARDARLVFVFDEAIAVLEDAGGGTPEGANRVVFELGAVPVNEGSPATASIALRVRDVLPALSNPLLLSAEVSASNESATLLGDNARVRLPTVLAEPDLATRLRVESSDPDPAACGGLLTLIATVENLGSTSASQATLTLSWPAALVGSVAEANGADAVGPSSASWTVGTVLAGAPPVERRIVLRLAEILPARVNPFAATALASSVDSDADPANNSSVANTTLSAGVDLVLSALVEPAGPVGAGDFVLYTYELSNAGCTAALDPCVESPYPSDVLNHWIGGEDLGGAVRTCVTGSLAPDAAPRRRVVMFQVVAPGTGEVRRDIPREHVAFETGRTPADDENPPDNFRSTHVTACFLDVAISSPSSPTVCMGASLTLVADSNVSEGLAYEWIAPNGGSFDDATAPVVLFTPPSTAGLYPVHVRLSHVSGCTTTTETNGQYFPVQVTGDCSSCGCHPANLKFVYVAGSLERTDAAGDRSVAAGETVAFRLDVADTGTGKSATLRTGSSFSFSDPQGRTYTATLAYPVHYECRETVTLTFNAAEVPPDMSPGSYRPNLIIDSLDACGNGAPRPSSVSNDVIVGPPLQGSADPGIEFSDWGPQRIGR